MTHAIPPEQAGPHSQQPLLQHPTASPTTAYLADEVGHLSLYFLLIDATRYNLGRPGEPAMYYAEALAKTLPLLPPYVRQQLVQDIAQALRKDAARQAMHHGQPSIDKLQNPVYRPAERQAWQGLLQVAAVLDTVPDEFGASAGS